MNLLKLAKYYVINFYGNISEDIFNRPFWARDHILRATSPDGLIWTKDPSFRYKYPTILAHYMSYYVTCDQAGNFLYHSTLYSKVKDSYHSTFEYKNQKVDLQRLGLDFCYSPCFVGDKLYGVGVESKTKKRKIVILKINTNGKFELHNEGLNLEKFDGLKSIEDIFIARYDDKFYVWCSGKFGKVNNSVYMWDSSDGLNFKYLGNVFATYDLDINNPCVVKLSDDKWRLYFREAQMPALKNVIRSAISSDLNNWTIEEGIRMSYGDKWDLHGVGFPYVFKKDNLWYMYYTGFWGRSKRGDLVAQSWNSSTI